MSALNIGTLLAAASICECSTAPGGRKVAAKLYEAARMTPRSDADASRALGEGEGSVRPAESIVTTAHYGRTDA